MPRWTVILGVLQKHGHKKTRDKVYTETSHINFDIKRRMFRGEELPYGNWDSVANFFKFFPWSISLHIINHVNYGGYKQQNLRRDSYQIMAVQPPSEMQIIVEIMIPRGSLSSSSHWNLD